MDTAWKEARFLSRWERGYACGVRGRAGSTEDVHRKRRRRRFWVRLVRGREVVFFRDGFSSAEEAMAWADAQMVSWLADVADAECCYDEVHRGGRL